MGRQQAMRAQPAGGVWTWRRAMQWAMLTAALALAACGGGSGDGNGAAGSLDSGARSYNDMPQSDREAARFLHQATFGATEADIAVVRSTGYRAWVEQQLRMPLNDNVYFTYIDSNVGGTRNADRFLEVFWQQSVQAPDQLRQRVAFALSQIFVISFNDAEVVQYPRGVASYYDMLARNAFGNFRTLLEDVTLHPMMGLYLTYLRNRKEDPVSGRVPDENYAREVMQLFTIGLYQLNPDGTPVRGGNGQPVETYTSEDVSGLAKVFTGWSWAGPDLDEARFNGLSSRRDPAREWTPMQNYPHHHSTSEKRFLGVVIAPQNRPEPELSLRVALDTLFNHPNVGPFICRQLIQRLVSSNPTPGQVRRCAATFDGQGGGVRGDMAAVVRAIVLDSDARILDEASAVDGKLREPVLRLTNYLRAFGATSQSGNFTGMGAGQVGSPETGIGQLPMHSPSVFNFFRPGYTPPNSTMAERNLAAPEMQLVHEVSVAGYLNYMRTQRININTGRDVQQDYTRELELARDPGALVARMDLLLAAGQLSPAARQLITEAVASRTVPAPTTNSSGVVTNQGTIDNALRDRVYIAVLLTMAAPEYLTLK